VRVLVVVTGVVALFVAVAQAAPSLRIEVGTDSPAVIYIDGARCERAVIVKWDGELNARCFDG